MIYNIFAGVIIGAGIILPGVSGAVLAVILGIYEKLIHSLNGFFKSPKKNLKFLLPIIVGMIIGLSIFGNVLKYLFSTYYIESCYAFIGLILGGVPILVRKAQDKGKINIIGLSMAFVLSLILFVSGNNKIDFSTSLHEGFSSYIKLFLTGFIFISGKVIPGISSSFMMMILGMYTYILNIISNPMGALSLGIDILLPLGLGGIVGLVIWVKLIEYLLKKYYSITYSIIIGFVIGSLPAIYPGFILNTTYLISTLLFILCFFGSYKLSGLSKE